MYPWSSSTKYPPYLYHQKSTNETIYELLMLIIFIISTQTRCELTAYQ